MGGWLAASEGVWDSRRAAGYHLGAEKCLHLPHLLHSREEGDLCVDVCDIYIYIYIYIYWTDRKRALHDKSEN